MSPFFFLLLVEFLLKFDNPVCSGNLVLDLFDLFLLKCKFLFNFSGVSSQVTKVDEPVVTELSNVFGEFIRGVSPKGRVRADNYFDVVTSKVRSYVMSRSVSRRQVVGVNTGKRFRFSQLRRSYYQYRSGYMTRT